MVRLPRRERPPIVLCRGGVSSLARWSPLGFCLRPAIIPQTGFHHGAGQRRNVMRQGSALTVLLFAGLAAAKEPSPWLTDFAAAQKEARRTGKPIFAFLNCHH